MSFGIMSVLNLDGSTAAYGFIGSSGNIWWLTPNELEQVKDYLRKKNGE